MILMFEGIDFILIILLLNFGVPLGTASNQI